eukprot:m.21288 g.21288  ORF g.21288 m.21288 type:complete len:113 (+) comp11121_c0_seq1:512-850(+)
MLHPFQLCYAILEQKHLHSPLITHSPRDSSCRSRCNPRLLHCVCSMVAASHDKHTCWLCADRCSRLLMVTVSPRTQNRGLCFPMTVVATLPQWMPTRALSDPRAGRVGATGS